MAGFKAHLTTGLVTGLVTGVLIAAAGTVSKDLQPAEAGAVLIVGTFWGLLPDMDSDTGKPLALLFQLISILVPTLMYPFFKTFQGRTLRFQHVSDLSAADHSVDRYLSEILSIVPLPVLLNRGNLYPGRHLCTFDIQAIWYDVSPPLIRRFYERTALSYRKNSLPFNGMAI